MSTNTTANYATVSAADLSAYHTTQLSTESSTELAADLATDLAADQPAVEAAHI